MWRPECTVQRAAALILGTAVVLMGAAGCSLLEPSQRISILTASAESMLEEGEHADRVVVHVRIRNDWGQPVYLHRHCGTAEYPARHLFADGGDQGVRIQGSDAVCSTTPLQGPIPIARGSTYEDTVTLRAPRGSPGGVYRIAYDIQLEDRVEGWTAAAPVIARSATTSNAFTVVPPGDDA